MSGGCAQSARAPRSEHTAVILRGCLDRTSTWERSDVRAPARLLQRVHASIVTRATQQLPRPKRLAALSSTSLLNLSSARRAHWYTQQQDDERVSGITLSDETHLGEGSNRDELHHFVHPYIGALARQLEVHISVTRAAPRAAQAGSPSSRRTAPCASRARDRAARTRRRRLSQSCAAARAATACATGRAAASTA